MSFPEGVIDPIAGLRQRPTAPSKRCVATRFRADARVTIGGVSKFYSGSIATVTGVWAKRHWAAFDVS
jgi:hypothetical protein